MSKATLEKYEALKAMNTLVKMLNNEEAYYGSWIYIIPDEASDDELMEIAADEPFKASDGEIIDLYADAVSCFLKLINKYGSRDGGFYIGRKVYGGKQV